MISTLLIFGLLAQATPAVPVYGDLPPVASQPGTTWMPPQASAEAVNVDNTFYFIYWVSVIFFILIVALMIYFVLRYRQRRAGELAAGAATHHTTLELTWSAVPLILVVIMFVMGFRGFMDMVTPVRDALQIRVQGQKWNWIFMYPNGAVSAELHLPPKVPVQLTLESADVIHSLWIPAFRIKRDAVPGRYNKMVLKDGVVLPGEYLALCAEYCGTQHSNMAARVVVHESFDSYQRWLADAADLFKTRTPAEVGAFLVKTRCGGCHTVTGAKHIGPPLNEVYDHDVPLATGEKVRGDDNYIRESIIEPRAKVVAGYDPVMPTFKGQLKDRDIAAIIDYLKELSEKKQ